MLKTLASMTWAVGRFVERLWVGQGAAARLRNATELRAGLARYFEFYHQPGLPNSSWIRRTPDALWHLLGHVAA